MTDLAAFTSPIFCLKMRHRFTLGLDFSKTVRRTAPKIQSVFNAKKNLKKSKYCKAAAARRASFTPIIASCEAILDNEAEIYVKRLATIMSKKWKTSYSRVLSYVRARFQICIIRSVSLCLRGSRTKWRGAGFVDHAAIPMNILEID